MSSGTDDAGHVLTAEEIGWMADPTTCARCYHPQDRHLDGRRQCMHRSCGCHKFRSKQLPAERDLLFDCQEPTQAEREARDVDPRPGWPLVSHNFEQFPEDYRLDQAQTDVLVVSEIHFVAGFVDEEYRRQLVGYLGHDQMLTSLPYPAKSPYMEVSVYMQRGGLHSDPLIRQIQQRAFSWRDRDWWTPYSCRCGHSSLEHFPRFYELENTTVRRCVGRRWGHGIVEVPPRHALSLQYDQCRCTYSRDNIIEQMHHEAPNYAFSAR